MKLSKKKKIIIGAAAVVVILGGLSPTSQPVLFLPHKKALENQFQELFLNGNQGCPSFQPLNKAVQNSRSGRPYNKCPPDWRK